MLSWLNGSKSLQLGSQSGQNPQTKRMKCVCYCCLFVFFQLLLAMYLLIVQNTFLLFLTSKSGIMKLSFIYVIYILSQRWIFIMDMAQVSIHEVNVCKRNPCETNLWVQTAPQCSLQFSTLDHLRHRLCLLSFI